VDEVHLQRREEALLESGQKPQIPALPKATDRFEECVEIRRPAPRPDIELIPAPAVLVADDLWSRPDSVDTQSDEHCEHFELGERAPTGNAAMADRDSFSTRSVRPSGFRRLFPVVIVGIIGSRDGHRDVSDAVISAARILR